MPTVLVTGANRGLGLEFARAYARDGWRVIAACRNPGDCADLDKVPGDVEIHRLDVVDHRAIDALARTLAGQPIDVLMNNAGVIGPKAQSFGSIDYAGWADTLSVNALAPVKMCESFADHVARSERKVMVAITSQMGSIADGGSGYYAYRTSKAALNMAMRSVAADLAGKGVKVAVFHPGWARTRMGGRGASVEPADAIAGIREIVERLTAADSGSFFHYQGHKLAW
jgi:NAD(P)-dependent dehydrogenase (short-subunit alcohol dehydrogenase family)